MKHRFYCRGACPHARNRQSGSDCGWGQPPLHRFNDVTNQLDAKHQYRRRMLLGRILSSVRYFATVRRAIGIPRLLKISTISLSLHGDPPSSFFTRSRMASFTLVLLMDSPLAV